MKETYKINIGGMVFHIDNDAYETLDQYLKEIEKRLSSYAEKKEITEDIELRVAELLQQRGKNETVVVTLEDVKSIIELLGNPEDIAGEEEDSAPLGETPPASGYKGQRRLYRDPANAYLGGVSGGLGAYFDVDPLVFRILFVVLFFAWGASAFVYILLWIIVPKAVTATQRLEMKGKNVTISNIEKNIRNEYNDIKTNFSKLSEEGGLDQRVRGFFTEVLRLVATTLNWLAKVLAMIIGIALIMAGFIASLSILGVMTNGAAIFTRVTGGYSITLYHSLLQVMESSAAVIFMIGIFLLFIIPLVLLIYAGIKLLFRFKVNDRAILLSGVGLWIIGILALTAIVLIEINGRLVSTTVSEEKTLQMDTARTINIRINPNVPEHEYVNNSRFTKESYFLLSEDFAQSLYIRPQLEIMKSADVSTATLLILKTARGTNVTEAKAHAQDIVYHWSFDDSTLLLNPYFYLQNDALYNVNRLSLKLIIPEDKTYDIGREVQYLLNDFDDVDELFHYDFSDYHDHNYRDSYGRHDNEMIQTLHALEEETEEE